MPDDRQCETRIEELPVGGDQSEDQGAERDEDKPVRSPNLGPLQHSGMPESFGEHVPPPLARMITATGRGFAELDDADDRCHGADKEHDTDDRDGQRHDDRGDSHGDSSSRAMRPQPSAALVSRLETFPEPVEGVFDLLPAFGVWRRPRRVKVEPCGWSAASRDRGPPASPTGCPTLRPLNSTALNPWGVRRA